MQLQTLKEQSASTMEMSRTLNSIDIPLAAIDTGLFGESIDINMLVIQASAAVGECKNLLAQLATLFQDITMAAHKAPTDTAPTNNNSANVLFPHVNNVGTTGVGIFGNRVDSTTHRPGSLFGNVTASSSHQPGSLFSTATNSTSNRPGGLFSSCIASSSHQPGPTNLELEHQNQMLTERFDNLVKALQGYGANFDEGISKS